MIIDLKTGDVNGDMVPDRVYLTGDLNQYGFYENISLMIEDGRTGYRYIIGLPPSNNTGMDPWIFLGSFSNNRVDDIFISLPLGARAVYYIVSFVNNRAAFILTPESLPENYEGLSKALGVEVIYRDFYKVDITSARLNQTVTLDISSRKEVYEGTLYNKDGTLIKPFKGFVLYSPHYYPIKFDGKAPYKLMAMDDIAGTSHADSLGSLVYYWKYSGNNAWMLDPEQFYVLL